MSRGSGWPYSMFELAIRLRSDRSSAAETKGVCVSYTVTSAVKDMPQTESKAAAVA